MKKVSILVLVVGYCVASVAVAQQLKREAAGGVRQSQPTLASQPTNAGPATELQPEPQSDPPTRGAHTCTVFPITFYGGATLFQADFFEDNNCNPPYLAYVYGNYPYPQTCPLNCLPSYCKDYACCPLPFYGLNAPVPADYEHEMPREKGRTYSKKCHTPDDVEFLRLSGVGGMTTVYVKVFSFKINTIDLINEVPPSDENYIRQIHFAFECQDPAVIGVDTAQLKVIRPPQCREIKDPNGAETTVYDVTFTFANGTAEAHILTMLCGDPVLPWIKPTKPEESSSK